MKLKCEERTSTEAGSELLRNGRVLEKNFESLPFSLADVEASRLSPEGVKFGIWVSINLIGDEKRIAPPS